MEEQYEAEIQKLYEEIAMLEAEKENCEREVSMQYGKYLHGVLDVLEEGDVRNKRDVAKLMEEIEKMEKNLDAEMKLNRITLTCCSTKTIQKSSAKDVQQYQLQGHCYHVCFDVGFTITEVQEKDAVTRRVSNLSIILDGQDSTDISSVLTRVEETNSLMLLFNTLKSFSENCKHRSKTFQHFKERYPELVSLPEGCMSSLLLAQSARLKGCTMCIHWGIDVSLEGEVRPKLDLVMKIPEEGLRMDSTNVVANAPKYFQNLLHAVGVETAIECILKTMLV
ncbi:centromere protein P isoform X2 [Engraulis encrasicolus]